MLPDPTLLDKKSWKEYILPRMGQFMGVLPEDDGKGLFYEKEYRSEIISSAWVMRSYPELDDKKWKKIVDYYIQMAPESLPPIKDEKEILISNLFKAQFAPFYFSPPSTLLVKFLSEGILASDAHTSTLYKTNQSWDIVEQQKFDSEGAVCFNRMEDGDIITFIGSFSPSDKPLGKILFFPKGKLKNAVPLVDSLRRPVHCSVADLNGDGKSDLIVSEFGKWAGVLSLHISKGNGNFERRVIMNKPGCVKTEVRDFNGDGLPDIMALFAQGDESMYIFYNKGELNFEQKQILRFPPTYGSSGFRLVDWNQDGKLDILHSGGDLADFPISFKPHHGIRIFTQSSADVYEEAEFIPFAGAYDAIPFDFDQDGDLDLAAISFFVDIQSKLSNGFCFFEKSGNKWIRNTFKGNENGRWITMDQGDPDSDGDQDLILGNLVMEFPQDTARVNRWIRDGIPFVVLHNQTIH